MSFPDRVISGAMHYFRTPPELWADRLTRLAAMGLNTVEAYVAWNFHAPGPGSYDFSEWRDLPRFVSLAADAGLDVILRPGPYICAEWDFGGLPAWLLRSRSAGGPGLARLRCSDPAYLAEVDAWFDSLIPRIVPLLSTRGGPIVAVQVENEYGSYGSDASYLAHLRDGLLRRGVDVPLFTSDGPGPDYLASGTLPDVLATVNFGSRPAEGFGALREFRPDSPLFCMEFWNGWFDHWGEAHHARDASEAAGVLDAILAAGASVNVYMAHGGTNFGLWSGANWDNGLQPTVTSYDYDAPVGEAGELTPKFFAFRGVIAKYAPVPGLPPSLLKPVPRLEPASIPVTGWAPLLGPSGTSGPYATSPMSLPAVAPAPMPLPMEDVGSGRGLILYRGDVLVPPDGRQLILDGLGDRAIVFADGERIADFADAEEAAAGVALPPRPDGTRTWLDILAENRGRVNFGPRLGLDRKGVTGIRLGSRYIHDWESVPLDLDDPGFTSRLTFGAGSPATAPGFAAATADIGAPADGFLSLPGWGRGFCWLNGFLLGRYDETGPQRTLYAPAPLWRPGVNDLVILELERPGDHLDIRDQPDLGDPELPERAPLMEKDSTTSTPGRRAILKAAAAGTGAMALGLTAQARPARAASSPAAADPAQTAAVRGLIIRYLGGAKAAQFELRTLPGGGPGTFTIGGTPGHVILSGTDGPALTAAFNWWLKYTAGGHVSWNYNQLNLPATLPAPASPVTVTTPYRIRMYGNPTWTGYTSPYWDWDRWQREIDYVAASSYTHVVVNQGTELLYYRLLRDYGYSDTEARAWIPGPAHQPWWWMDNIYDVDGPLSMGVLERRAALAVQVFDRMRELGITPLIPGFIGFVPVDFAYRNHGADVVDQGPWSGYTRPALLNPGKAPFADLAGDYYGYQKKLFGEGFAYWGDFLHEGGRQGDIDLAAAAAGVQTAMQKASPGSLWMLQGWGGTPKQATIEGLVDKSLTWVADLQTDANPGWTKTSAWWGAPWTWGTISNAGGNVALYGRLPGINTGLTGALASPNRGDLAGIHFAPEAGDMNPVLADYIADMAWRTQPVDLTSWIQAYSDRRYGTASAPARSAWQTLLTTAYGAQGNTGNVVVAPDSLFNAQPALDTQSANPYGATKIPYDPGKLFGVARNLLDAAPALASQATFRYDLLDVTRQLHSNASRVLLPQISDAYRAGDRATFSSLAGHWLALMTRLDTLLGTEPSYMIGPWLADAAALATTPDEQRTLSYDARNILAAWGNRDGWFNGLGDYSNRDFNGLVGDFYHSRWSAYFDYLSKLQGDGTPPAAIDWFAFDEAWSRRTGTYPVQPSGDVVKLASAAWTDLAADPMYAQVTVAASQTEVKPGDTVTATVTFTNASAVHAASGVSVMVTAPAGLTVTPAVTRLGDVAAGGISSAKVTVTVPADAAPSSALDQLTVTATATCSFDGKTVSGTGYAPLLLPSPVQPPNKTVAFTSASFGQHGSDYAIYAGGDGGALLFGDSAFAAIYQASVLSAGGSVTTKVTQLAPTGGYAEAGILVRNDLTAKDSAGCVFMSVTPDNSVLMGWDGAGNGRMNSYNQTEYAAAAPLYLRLTRDTATSYTGYYSADGKTWTKLGSGTVPGGASAQDASLFTTAGGAVPSGIARFSGFTIA